VSGQQNGFHPVDSLHFSTRSTWRLVKLKRFKTRANRLRFSEPGFLSPAVGLSQLSVSVFLFYTLRENRLQEWFLSSFHVEEIFVLQIKVVKKSTYI